MAKGGKSLAPTGSLATPVDFRLTVRTHMVLTAIAELSEQGSDPSNRQISDAAGIRDQGQISKLLARLESHGLLHNTGGQTLGIPNAWQLTAHGQEIARAGYSGRRIRTRLHNDDDQGDKVKPTEHTAKPHPTPKTGRFATLRGSLHIKGTRAPTEPSELATCSHCWQR